MLLFLAVSLASSAQFFLVVVFLALRRAPVSSDWLFVWDSLRPSSTQLLVRDHSGFFLSLILGWAPFSSECFFLQTVPQSSTLFFF